MEPVRAWRILVVQRLRCLWIARLIEHDISVEGGTAEAATDGLIRLVLAHVEYDRRHARRPLSAFAATPARYADLFEWGTELYTHRRRLDDGNDVSFRIAVARERAADRWARSRDAVATNEPTRLKSTAGRLPQSRHFSPARLT